MRPTSLTITAFGPFPGSETIRFSELGENPLFLINGPTGAGKTTILDAICFALYGKTTGDEREGAQMRCGLTAGDLLTEVTLEFEFSGRRFRIRRLPEQQRPKARGEGTTVQSPEAQLVELLADGSEKLLVPSKVSEATKEIEELTGLSVDQFRQVMVLPQGKFRQLLMADSNEREKIFGQLFQTRIYRRLEEHLKAQAAEIRRERERQLQLQQGILEGAEVAAPEELERELTELEPEADGARSLKEAMEGLFTAADGALLQGRALQRDFARLEQATAEMATLEKGREQVEDKRLRLRQGDGAARLQPHFADRNRCERELTEAQEKVEEADTRQKKAEEGLTTAAQLLTESQPLQAELDGARGKAAQLDGYRIRTERLTAARQACKEAEANAERAELRLQHKTLSDRLALLLDLERQTVEVSRQQERLQVRRTRGGELRQRHEELERHAKELELSWHQGQAAILAAELEEGSPCPVCGSREHPAPATSDHPLPSQQQVEQARQAARQAGDELHSAREAFAEEQDRLRDLLQQQERCRSELGDDAAGSAASLKEELDALRARAERLGLPLPDPQQTRAADAKQLRGAAEDKKRDAAAARALVETAEQELPEAYRHAGALTDAVERTRRQIEDLKNRIQDVADNHQRAQSEATAARTAAEAAEEQRRKTQTALQQARATCLSALQGSPFADEAAYRAALLTEKDREALKAKIDGFDATRQRLTGALQELQERLLGKEHPDLERLEADRTRTEAERKEANERWLQLDRRLKLLESTRKKLAKAASERDELDRRYAVIGTLSDVANGQTGDKISLQRFVLSVLLDDVLIEASRRLSLMSKGRYQLLRKEDRAKGNKASGLELEVEDAYDGKVRPVATLSGGESFMAALSMALGLSDVVQAYAGGIRLDTLFIDEGFGSLDAESLDLAVRTLIDLQAAGRMVGVISHVAELKEQMPLRLDVLAGRDGSRVRLVAP